MVIVIHVQVMTWRVKTFLLFGCLLLKISHVFLVLTCPKNSFRGRSCRFEEPWGVIYTNIFNKHLLLHWQLRERTATSNTTSEALLTRAVLDQKADLNVRENAEASHSNFGWMWSRKHNGNCSITDSKSKKKCIKLKELYWKGLLGYSSLFKWKSQNPNNPNFAILSLGLWMGLVVVLLQQVYTSSN